LKTGFSIVLGSIVIGAGIAVSGYVTELGKQQIASQKMAACWSSPVTQTLDSLVTQVALSQLKSSYPAGMTQQDQDAVSNSFSATVRNYSFAGAVPDSGTINCNGSIAISYTRPDNSKYSKDQGDIISYQINPSANGWDAEMNQADIPSSLITYVAGAPVSAQPAASAQ
jgi:hypothetical protein